MKVRDLENVLRLLMAQGKGDYDVIIEPNLFNNEKPEIDVDHETKTVTL